MRIGIVSDIHCNRRGLDQALLLMGEIDQLWCAGDAVNQYRFSNEVVGRLRELDARYVLGNHEYTLLAPESHRATNRPDVDPELLNWMGERPWKIRETFDDLTVLMFHSTPWPPWDEYLYPHNPQLNRWDELKADVAIYGHTHTQLARQTGSTLIINPGSAGHAQDPSNGKLLPCAVLDTNSRHVQFHNFEDPARSRPAA